MILTRTSRSIRLAVASTAALVAAGGLLVAPAAGAATPTERTYSDPVEPGKAYDLRVEVTATNGEKLVPVRLSVTK